jgi:hypothetical protein
MMTDILIFLFFLNIIIPSFLLLVDFFDTKLQCLISYIIPMGAIFVMLYLAFKDLKQDIKYRFNKLK